MERTARVRAEGHLIDSGTLSKIFDRVIQTGSTYEILDFRIGRTNTEPSVAELRIDAATPEILDDLLFSLVNWARKMKLDPEAHLREATARFERRFRSMEKAAGKPLKEHDLPALDRLWEAAKAAERG